MSAPVLVVKLGGELIEASASRDRLAHSLASIAKARPLVVVHGGGKAIDAELDRRGVAPRKVDGLRVTDAATLDAVISVLAGAANTALVASLVSSGVRAVGLTGVDAGFARATRALPLQSTSGELVDLGLVGDPVDADPALVDLLLSRGYVPVVASLGLDHPGGAGVLNVNADVMACRLAAALGADELIICGTTAGVLDARGRSIARLDAAGIDRLIASGTANAGMVTKLRACLRAIEDGVGIVRVVDGRALGTDLDAAPGTTLSAALQELAN